MSPCPRQEFLGATAPWPGARLTSPGWQRTHNSAIISIYSQFLEQGDAGEGLCEQLSACGVPFRGALRGHVQCSRSRVTAGCLCAKPQSCCCTRAPGWGAAATTCAVRAPCCWLAFTLQHDGAPEPAFLPSLAVPPPPKRTVAGGQRALCPLQLKHGQLPHLGGENYTCERTAQTGSDLEGSKLSSLSSSAFLAISLLAVQDPARTPESDKSIRVLEVTQGTLFL